MFDFLDDLDYSKIIGGGLEGLGTFAGAMYGPQAGGYGATQAGWEQQMQLDRDKFLQSVAQQEIANQINREQTAAMIAAANIQAGASKESALITQQTNIMQMRNKALADSLAAKIEAVKGNPQVRFQYDNAITEAMNRQPERYMTGFNNAAAVLARAGQR